VSTPDPLTPGNNELQRARLSARLESADKGRSRRSRTRSSRPASAAALLRSRCSH